MATDLTIAKTILDQIKTIDPRALWAWGSKQYVGNENSVSFKVGGMTRWKGTVQITLNGRDLYDVRFFKLGRKLNVKEDVTVDDVFAEDLVNVIDEKVG